MIHEKYEKQKERRKTENTDLIKLLFAIICNNFIMVEDVRHHWNKIN